MISRNQLSAGSLTRFAIQSAFVGLGFSGLSVFYSDFTKALDSASRYFFFSYFICLSKVFVFSNLFSIYFLWQLSDHQGL